MLIFFRKYSADYREAVYSYPLSILATAREHGCVELLCDILDTLEFVLNVFEGGNLSLGLFDIQAAGVVRVEFREFATLLIALSKVLVVVQGAVVGGNAIALRVSQGPPFEYLRDQSPISTTGS